jgi:hypothetical protein
MRVRSDLARPRAVISWAWDQELIEALPRFPKPKPQRDVAGRHYLTKAEINALYFATHKMERPRGWDSSFAVGRFSWRPLQPLSRQPTRRLACCQLTVRVLGTHLAVPKTPSGFGTPAEHAEYGRTDSPTRIMLSA